MWKTSFIDSVKMTKILSTQFIGNRNSLTNLNCSRNDCIALIESHITPETKLTWLLKQLVQHLPIQGKPFADVASLAAVASPGSRPPAFYMGGLPNTLAWASISFGCKIRPFRPYPKFWESLKRNTKASAIAPATNLNPTLHNP